MPEGMNQKFELYRVAQIMIQHNNKAASTDKNIILRLVI